MRKDRPVRLIRKQESRATTELSSDDTARTHPEPSEREIKAVVSRWVHDHRRRSEEFRRTFAALWQSGEFQLPSLKS